MDTILIGAVDIDRINVEIREKLLVFLTSCEFIYFLCSTMLL
jgi:hypothetical protein